jgi:uncharacterized protein (TIGR00251 family)
LRARGHCDFRRKEKHLTTEDTEEITSGPSTQDMIPIHDNPSGASFTVKVHPRAKKNAITGELGDALKLSLIAPPVEGRANEACIELLANLLKVPRSSVTIASGQNSRRKVIRVAGLSAAEITRRLGL